MWEGFNYFICKSTFMTGPTGVKPVIMTFTAMFIPYILFISFTSKV